MAVMGKKLAGFFPRDIGESRPKTPLMKPEKMLHSHFFTFLLVSNCGRLFKAIIFIMIATH
jgi:hypothetical protein